MPILNVKDSPFNAAGDATVNDGPAIQAAINAAGALQRSNNGQTATSAKGSVVYLPQGIYRIECTLHVPSGVGLRGDGMRTTQLRFYVDQDPEPEVECQGVDGIVFDQGNEAAGQFHVGGFLEDLDVMTGARESGTETARDLVVVDHFVNFAINRVRVYAADRYNLRISNPVHLTATHLASYEAGVSNLWIEGDPNTMATTCNFQGCHFQGTQDGPCADVAGLGFVFDGCVFEFAGRRTGSGGYGVRVRAGNATFTGPYFEGNSHYDLIVGTQEDLLPGSNQKTSVTLVNPVVTSNEGRVQDSGAVRIERGSATLVGGDYQWEARPIVLGPDVGGNGRADRVTVLGVTLGNKAIVNESSASGILFVV